MTRNKGGKKLRQKACKKRVLIEDIKKLALFSLGKSDGDWHLRRESCRAEKK